MGHRAVILGAGVGGLVAADRLRELLRDEDEVIVVDPAPERVLGLSLLWVMRGWRQCHDVRFTPSAIHRPGIEIVPGVADEIILGEKVVRLEGRELGFDALVVAVGARLEPALLPGLREALETDVAGEYYTLAGAGRLHDILERFEGGRLCVLVSRVPFRCPAAPYEGAFLIDDFLTERRRRDAVELCVYTPEPQPMPVAGPAVGESLIRLLGERRIGFEPGTTIERIEPESRQLVFEGGERTRFDLLVAVPPHVPPAPVVDAGFAEAGWIPVEPRSLTTTAEGVWALGDVSMLKLANGLPLPKAAVFAVGQGEAVANGVARHLGRDAPQPWFTGRGHCWIELGGRRAAKGVGSFLEPSGPIVELYGPSFEHHAEKEAEERGWIAQWTGSNSASRKPASALA
jgi:sulfide:quinone oxidoreductase